MAESIPADLDFFSPPQTTAVQGELIADESGDEKAIRLLGFVHGADGAAALLKIDSQLIRLKEGESHDSVTLLTVDGRSATLQRNRKRWTLVLLDQPITNQAARRPPIKRSRETRATSSPIPAPEALPLAIDPVDDFPEFDQETRSANQQRNRTRDTSTAETPSFPDAPEIPELPDLDGLPELPGL